MQKDPSGVADISAKFSRRNEKSGVVGFRGPQYNTRSTLSSGLQIQDEDDMGFEEYMIRPSQVRDIWRNSKSKNAMFTFMCEHFKPRTQYEPERVEYNALNILSEYQVYNLEYCKNELCLTDVQTSLVLDLFWSLLEFDPDEKVKGAADIEKL